jgi:hypothetical protein
MPEMSDFIERLIRLEGRVEALEKTAEAAVAFRRGLTIAIISVAITSVVALILHFT